MWWHYGSHHKDFDKIKFLCGLLGIDSPPKCEYPGCQEDCAPDYAHYRFYHGCWDHLGKLPNNFTVWQHNNPEKFLAIVSATITNWNKQNYDILAERGRKALDNWKSTHYEEVVERGRKALREFTEYRMKVGDKIARPNFSGWNIVNKNRKPENILSSKGEYILVDKLKHLLNVEIIHQFNIETYSADIYIPKYNLIIELDGSPYHELEKDVLRDIQIYESFHGLIKIRRYDYNYFMKYMSDYDLVYSIILESTIALPYWERIPFDELMYWKWNVFQTGPMRLLTYNKEDK